MDRVFSWSSFDEDRENNPALSYWLSRPPEARIAEVQRLRGEYRSVFGEAGDMDFHKDFADLCSLLNAGGVHYLIVGGYAVAFHGAPRFTGDLDVLVRPEIEHIRRLLHALRDYGFPADDVGPEYLLDPQKILQLGRFPVQIHVMSAISGLTWDQAWSSRQAGKYGESPSFISGAKL